MKSRRGRKGLSLVEAIVSIFLLSGAILMSGALMQSAFNYQSMSKQRVEAVVLAQRTMAQVQAWAWTVSGGKYNYNGDWSAYQGRETQVGAYTVKVDSSPRSIRLSSPCSALESIHGAGGRFMDSSVVPVRVTVEWQDSHSISLFTYIGEPPRLAESVTVAQISGGDPLPSNGFGEFSARAFDTGGEPIEDVMFRWYLAPSGNTPGNGSLVPPWGGQVNPPVAQGPRDGRTASVKNSYRKEDGSWAVVGGQVRVEAATRSLGRQTVGERRVEMSP